MIFDSEAQKNFVLEAVRKFPTNYETALQLANTFGQSLQEGQIIPIKQQLEKFPVQGIAKAGEKSPTPTDGGSKAADTDPTKAVKVTIKGEDLKKVADNGAEMPSAKEQPAHDLTKGPAPK